MDLNKIRDRIIKTLTKVSPFLVYFLIVLIPLTHKELFAVGDPDLVVSKFLLVLISIIGIVAFVIYYRKYIKDPVFVLLLLLTLFQLLSLTQTQSLLHSTRMVLFGLAVLFTYPTLRLVIESGNGVINKLIYAMLFAYSIVFLFLMYQMFMQNNHQIAVGGVWPISEIDTRFGATFWDVNHFGAYLASLILLVIGYLLQVRRKLDKRVISLLVVIIMSMLFALYATKSRSAMVGMFFGLSVLVVSAFYSLRKTQKTIKVPFSAWIFVSGSVIVTAVIFVTEFASTLHDALLYRGVSLFSHLFLLKAGLQTGLDNYLFGIGTNAFDSYFKGTDWASAYYFIDPAAISHKLPLHSIWLESFAETGIFSFVIFIIFWLTIIISLISLTIRKKDYIALGFAAGIVSFLVGGLVYSYKSEFFWVYVLIGAAYAMSKVTKDNYRETLKEVLGENIKYVSILFGVFSLVALMVPVFFVTQPMFPHELELINSVTTLNPVSNFYQNYIQTLRHVFGNYAYTARIASFIFYVASVLLLFGISRRTANTVTSLLLTAILVYVTGLFTAILDITANWPMFYLFLLALSVFIVLIDHYSARSGKSEKNENCGLGCKLYDKFQKPAVLGIALLALMIIYFVSYNYNYKSRYNSDQTFMLELAHNIGIFDYATPVIDSSVDFTLAHYYCDKVINDNNDYELSKCIISQVTEPLSSEDKTFNISKKYVVVGEKDFVSTWKENVQVLDELSENIELETVHVKYGDIHMLMHQLARED